MIFTWFVLALVCALVGAGCLAEYLTHADPVAGVRALGAFSIALSCTGFFYLEATWDYYLNRLQRSLSWPTTRK